MLQASVNKECIVSVNAGKGGKEKRMAGSSRGPIQMSHAQVFKVVTQVRFPAAG